MAVTGSRITTTAQRRMIAKKIEAALRPRYVDGHPGPTANERAEGKAWLKAQRFAEDEAIQAKWQELAFVLYDQRKAPCLSRCGKCGVRMFARCRGYLCGGCGRIIEEVANP